MADRYRIFGAELSPYSVKVRSYFRYKGLDHEWLVRSGAVMDEFQRYARLPLIPLVVTPDGRPLQDSTPILEEVEALHPVPSIHPSDPTLSFLSALLEEYADEWVNKPMFHYRWGCDVDGQSASRRLAGEIAPEAAFAQLEGMAEKIAERMVSRLGFVGSSEQNQLQIEASFERLLSLLEAHFEARPFLFGGRPAFGDFGLYAQLYEASTDPTPGAHMRASSPRVLDWIARMLDPAPGSASHAPFEAWQTLAPTLAPILSQEVAALFLPWSAANARALAAGESSFSVQLEGRSFCQDTQKYHARSLAKLRERFAVGSPNAELEAILGEAGCLAYLRAEA